MSCQHRRTAQPRPLFTTLVSLPLLFASSAWAAPLSNLTKRDSNGPGNTMIVRLFIPHSCYSPLAHVAAFTLGAYCRGCRRLHRRSAHVLQEGRFF